MKSTEKRAICGICPAGCWVIVDIDDRGRLKSARADETSDLGIICRLGEHSADIVYSKDRLLHPLRRKGAKGTYDFERISWDNAYEIIVGRLQKIKAESGPEATAIYTGRGSFELAMCDIYQPAGVAVSSASSVLFPFGSPNTLGVGALCYVSFAMIAPHVTMGGMLINMFSDIENAELVVVWGANPATDSPPLDFHRIQKAAARGAHVIVIDPRRTRTVKVTGAQWIPIRPGTDGALALGLCRVLIEEELYDEHFVKTWTRGFDDFARYVRHFRPDVVEDITGVPEETVISLARWIAEADGAAPVMYSGLEYSNSGVQAIRATFAVWALAGQLDVPGSRCFAMPGSMFPLNKSGLVANPDETKSLGRDRFPVYSAYRGESHAIALPDSVLKGDPYRIRALMILGGSIITAWPEPKIWKKTLKNLDFLVSIDRQATADAAYADIVLPATTMYEIQSYMTYGPIFRIREKVIEPPGEARNDFFILAELARRLGYGHLYPQNEDELLQRVLKNSGFTLQDVRKAGGTVRIESPMQQYKKWEKGTLRTDGKPGFETPSGKFEFASTILEEHGYDPLPVYTEPAEGPRSRPEWVETFPLVFNSGSRVTTDFRSQHHGIEALVKKRPEPLVQIHTADAAERNIQSGDMVKISTARGSLVMRAFVTDDIMKGAVDADMGGGGPVGPEAWRNTNINELTDLQNYDPISGFPVYKSLLCQIHKEAEGTREAVTDSGEDGAALWITKPDNKPVRRIYLDHNATTPLDPEVLAEMVRHMERTPGNPSSIYAEGKTAKSALDSARRQVARLINSTAKRIVFTGGGSESDNLAVKGAARTGGGERNRIITSAIEHPAVLGACRDLEKEGFDLVILPVDSSGRVRVGDLRDALNPKTRLVSIMMANNETGVIQPIAELVKITHAAGALFHCDAVQAAGKIPVDVRTLGVDLLTLSAHKFHGPKGIGVLYVRAGVDIRPLVSGGKQESGLRAGTENVTAVIGMGRAADLAVKRLPEMAEIGRLRDRLEAGIKRVFPEARLNGHREKRIPATLNMTLPGLRGESVVLAMDQKGVALSPGSACRAGSPDPSHALLAMGLSEEEAHCSVRFSLGIHTTEEDVDGAIACFDQVVRESRNTVRFVPCR
ncbi:MAG: IscS subfamily cysteine desulfurase [Acidobacteriota bacterium]|nr:IscS subfamily cysteine desulfurase [Acidobacteriota bacterium]